jgi:CheY-like chemotaxis protein
MDNNAKQILVVEDEKFISDLYVRALSRSNYEVTVVSDGEKALSEIQKGTYDIVLLDIMMPNLTGIEILNRLDQTRPKLSTKIIVATNLELPPESRSKVEAMADGYIIKAEITPNELVEYLDSTTPTVRD